MTRWALFVWLLVPALGGAAGSRAQGAPPSPAEVWLDAQDDHLMRVGAWGGASLVSGVLMLTLGADPEMRSYGGQTAVWGAAHLTFAGVGLAARGHPPPRSAEDERAAEARLARMLTTHLLLNAGYAALGTAVWATAPDGSEGASRRGHGAALVTQGTMLLLLDGVAYVAWRRHRAGADAPAHVRASPAGIRVVVSL